MVTWVSAIADALLGLVLLGWWSRWRSGGCLPPQASSVGSSAHIGSRCMASATAWPSSRTVGSQLVAGASTGGWPARQSTPKGPASRNRRSSSTVQGRPSMIASSRASTRKMQNSSSVSCSGCWPPSWVGGQQVPAGVGVPSWSATVLASCLLVGLVPRPPRATGSLRAAWTTPGSRAAGGGPVGTRGTERSEYRSGLDGAGSEVAARPAGNRPVRAWVQGSRARRRRRGRSPPATSSPPPTGQGPPDQPRPAARGG